MIEYVSERCRDRCGDCTFASISDRQHSLYLEPNQVLATARESAALGCKEAMFTLCDKPEDRSRQAREWLDAHGYDDTLSHVRATLIRVLEETGLLTHLKPGVMSWQDFQRLKPAAPSMGMMPETTATAYSPAKARTSLTRRTNSWLWTFH
jgi:FO synthase